MYMRVPVVTVQFSGLCEAHFAILGYYDLLLW